ncbi:hypothetical protein KO527_25275 [Pseudoalteromonas sp. C2R02]|uniref:hypothetical protein n=1 Tax=Pseudoalteromonas sp. C2R02 TaxID=2841565 RepID=UPI001C08A3F1|nr:hypothetical protein [Pseudoalteromonas sp. C2R02]MBU2972653.1 hypothetical protein [Pseudoalteromonas sp. C2R02]
MQSSYVTQIYKNDPLKFLIKVMDLTHFSKNLEKINSSLYILTGISTYRNLPPLEKQKINAQVLALKKIDGPLCGKLYGLIAQLNANPYWFSWSLSDSELRSFFEVNSEAKTALGYIGIQPSSLLTVSGIAAIVLGISKNGLYGGVKEVASARINYTNARDITQQLSKNKISAPGATKIGLAAAFVTVFASVLLAATSSNYESAKKELLLRGLLESDKI